MKKFIVSLTLLSLMAMPAVSLAAPCPGCSTGCLGDCTSKETCEAINGVWANEKCTGVSELDEDAILTTINGIINWLFAILLIVATIMIVIGGFMFVTSGGDPGRTGTARNMIIYAAVGVAVALLAKGLIALVQSMVG